MKWVWTAILALLTVGLFVMVVQGAIFVGWALGGVIGVILAILLAVGMIKEYGFFAGLIGIIVIVLLIDLLF